MTLLQIEDLQTCLSLKEKKFLVSDNISLDLQENEILGLIGESGCGKTLTCLSMAGLVPKHAIIQYKRFIFQGREIDLSDPGDIKKMRAKGISYIFQESASHINPLFCIGDQIAESVFYSLGLKKEEAKKESLLLLEQVGLTPATQYYKSFSHQLSGGMNQRAMIALALSSRPKILVADEPTTALDASIQNDIVNLVRSLIRKLEVSVIWITHDISLIQNFADRIAIMYAGRIVEIGESHRIFTQPAHPYTKALISCLPENLKQKRFTSITGEVADLSNLPGGCKFHPRCPFRMEQCLKIEPDFITVDIQQKAKCYLLPKG